MPWTYVMGRCTERRCAGAAAASFLPAAVITATCGRYKSHRRRNGDEGQSIVPHERLPSLDVNSRPRVA